MNGRVAKMLRDTGAVIPREKQHRAKKAWFDISKEQRGELMAGWKVSRMKRIEAHQNFKAQN